MEEKEITLSELIKRIESALRYLLGRWQIIILAGFLMGLGGILYAWMQKVKYTAVLTFVTETDSKGPVSSYAGIAAQFGIDLGGGSNSLFEGENLIELLRSRSLIVQTLLEPTFNGAEPLLIEEYLSINSIQENSKSEPINFSGHRINESRYRDSILFSAAENIIKNNLFIGKRDKKLSLIDLQVVSTNELFAKRFAEQLAENAIQYYTDYKVRKARQNVLLLEKQTDSVRSILFGSIHDVAASTDLNVNPIKQSVRTGTQRKQIDVQVNSALYVELIKNLELSRLNLRKETPLIQVIDTPILPLKKKGIGRLYAGLVGGVIGSFLAIFILLLSKWFSSVKRNT
jgi:uncharacterized protein involved in exopolysaccharide biosynthesis